MRKPLSIAICAAVAFAPPHLHAQQADPMQDDRREMTGLKYLSNTTYPTGYRNASKWLVAGLSGIDFDPKSNRFVVVRDNVMPGALPNGSGSPNVFYLTASSRPGEQGYRLTFTDDSLLDGNPRIDTPESVRFDPAGNGLWFANEGTGSLFHWREDNSRTQFVLPQNAQGNASGNKGLEGMTFTPSGDLWIGTERNKPGDPVRLTRLSQVDRQGNVLKQYVYRLDDLSGRNGRLDQENGVSEILAVDDKTLLVMERAWDGTSATAQPRGCRTIPSASTGSTWAPARTSRTAATSPEASPRCPRRWCSIRHRSMACSTPTRTRSTISRA
ncbi:hypothetical protein XthCFBP4691_03650 [Xanthomonas theicola]|uniref:Phytase-like domain-containing protein n=1 Tax=Xanthomonas theicola TaxID=56464 RepID=A0A2S6ZJJ1_9XANT|nr:hypothetical protein XthCFBP4691_03650 [Xanthomonas theicola]